MPTTPKSPSPTPPSAPTKSTPPASAPQPSSTPTPTKKRSTIPPVEVSLTGQKTGPPTLQDIAALARQLTGREPTVEELTRAKAILEDRTDPTPS